MNLVDMDTAKLHLRVDGDEEDTLIALMLEASEHSCLTYLNRGVYADADALDASADKDGIVTNQAIHAAILLLLGHLYTNREDVVVGVPANKLPQGSRWLLNPYRFLPGV